MEINEDDVCEHCGFADCICDDDPTNPSTSQAAACANPLAPVVPCTSCGKPVHTCEDSVRGDAYGDYTCRLHPDGAELSGRRGEWVCSEDCYKKATVIRVSTCNHDQQLADLTARLTAVEQCHNEGETDTCEQLNGFERRLRVLERFALHNITFNGALDFSGEIKKEARKQAAASARPSEEKNNG